MATWKTFRTSLLLVSLSLSSSMQTLPAQSAVCQDAYQVTYEAWIPNDHDVVTLLTCTTSSGQSSPYTYLGDSLVDPAAFPGEEGYRVQQNAMVYALEQTGFDGSIGVGKTYRFGYLSPENGQYISNYDLDNTPNDCFLYDASTFADPTNIHGSYTSNGTVGETASFDGSITNPLASFQGSGISWHIQTTINQSTPGGNGAVTIEGSTSCYPSHRVSINGQVVYEADADPNASNAQIAYCLTGPGTTTVQQIATVYPQ